MSLFTTATCPCCSKKMISGFSSEQDESRFCEGDCNFNMMEDDHPNAIYNCSVHQRAFVWDDNDGIIEVAYYNVSEIQAMANG
jgi:hypothetical protein